MDNIRWLVIVLVLSMHSADTYSPFGNWYYTERPKLDFGTLLFFGTYQSFLQAFFMGLLFFIAGYFTPRSYDSKGAPRFLLDRFLRLGIPTLLYMLAIGPLTEYFVSRSWHTKRSFPDAWLKYVRSGDVLSGSGPLWFCLALLMFSIGYAAVRQFPRSLAPTQKLRAVPRLGAIAGFVAGLGLSTFAIRVWSPSGAVFFNLQLADFPQYILMFVLGAYAWRLRWLARLDADLGKRVAMGALLAGLILWAGLLVFGGALAGETSAYSGGLTWQNFGMSLWAAIICAGMSLGILIVFREHFDAQGRIARFMADNAFAVYVFHPPILIGIAIILHTTDVPALPKFLLLTALSATASFAAAQLVFRRIPWLKRIL
jgi:glucan biosynthesis protein C